MNKDIQNIIRSYTIIFMLIVLLLDVQLLADKMDDVSDRLEHIEFIEEEIILGLPSIPIETQETHEPTEIKAATDENIQQPMRGGGRDFTITAYDNSVESQGQWVNQTATGFNLKDKSLQEAKCIAVDPKVIPLGSKVELTFDEPYQHLNDIYIARDTGGAIKGERIDLFMGDGVDKQVVRNFGRRKVKVRIID